MKANVGSIDKILRIVVGLALIAMAVMNVAPIGVWGWIGVIPLVTGLAGFCPLYSLIGMSTRK
jgi:hypothetical protein